jgi:hypothetical protein
MDDIKKLICAVFLCWCFGTPAFAQVTTDTFNVMDYGAVCNGIADDTAAFNAAFAAARVSPAYTSSIFGTVIVTGPTDASHPACQIGGSGTTHGINATGFTAWNINGNGSSPGHLIIRNMNLPCSNPGNQGVICLDLSDSLNVSVEQSVSIYGNHQYPPLIGMQEANVIKNTPCCIHHITGAQITGYYIFSAVYNMSAESTTYQDVVFGNALIGRGSINSLGSITGGSGYNGGTTNTFNNVSLTGGSGVGAIGNVTVTSGVVTKVIVANRGKGYVVNDVLSATAVSLGNNGGSGFSVPVATLVNWALVMDGQDHYAACSFYAGCTATQDAILSFTQVNMFGGSLRGNLSALDLVATSSAHFWKVYMNTEWPGLAQPCVYLEDTGLVSASNLNLYMESTRCETNTAGGVGDFYLTGANTVPILPALHVSIDYEKGTGITGPCMFNIDPQNAGNTSGAISISDADITWQVFNKLPMFCQPYAFTVTGKVAVFVPYNFNAPYAFSGTLCQGVFSNSPNLTWCTPSSPPAGPSDLLVTAAAWEGGTRQMSLNYHGPLMTIQRASDSVTANLVPDNSGTFNETAAAAFCAGTTCGVQTLYDQSGNGHNATQTTQSCQPTLNINDTVLSGRSSITFATGTCQALVIAAATSINDIFSGSGGTMSVVFSKGTSGATNGRIASKTDGSTVGWSFQTVGTGTTFPELIQQASGSAGTWESSTSLGSSLPAVVDFEYTNASIANLPNIFVAGLQVAFSTSTQPTGTIGSDAAQNLILGNLVGTGGTNAFTGNIAEWSFFSPTTALTVVQLEALRRNQAAFYGITFPVVH